MTVVGVTGHQNMPAVARDFAAARIRELLGDLGAGLVGVSSLAAGADQIFARIILELGGELHAVIPSADYEKTFDDDGARNFRTLLAQARQCDILPFPEPSESAFMAAGRAIVDKVDWLCAVWDGAPARGIGGTSDAVQYARSKAKPVKVIWPEGVTR
jgi:hypothetical protein